MDTEAETRIDRPHSSIRSRTALRALLHEINQAIRDFLIALEVFVSCPTQDNAEHAWRESRMAWGLLLPHRGDMLRTNRTAIEELQSGIERLQLLVRDNEDVDVDLRGRLAQELIRRRDMLNALLADEGESRLRALLVSERAAAELGR